MQFVLIEAEAPPSRIAHFGDFIVDPRTDQRRFIGGEHPGGGRIVFSE
jgi:hypothetical protein